MPDDLHTNQPLVSAVIPTRNRPNLVCDAVRSALSQSYKNLEVIVVIDGPDPSTVKALESLNEPRVVIVALQENVGGSEARNIGVIKAKGEWIALLDDDDTWFPDKLSKQVEVALMSASESPIVTTRVIAKRIDASLLWPDRQPRPEEPLSEYLICRTRISSGEGFIQCSTLLAKRSLFLEQPFTKGLPRGQDWDWLLRATDRPKVAVEWVWEPLVVYDITGGHATITGKSGWKDIYIWAKQLKQITPKAFRYYLASHITPRLRIPRDLPAVPGLLVEMLPLRHFSLKVLQLFLVFFLVPISFRHALAQRGFGGLSRSKNGHIAKA